MRKRRKGRELEESLQLFLIEVEALHQSPMQVSSFYFYLWSYLTDSDVICCRKCGGCSLVWTCWCSLVLIFGMFSVIILEETKLFLIILILFCYCLSGISLFFPWKMMIQWLVFWVGNCSNIHIFKKSKQPKKRNTRTHREVFFLCVWVRQEE